MVGSLGQVKASRKHKEQHMPRFQNSGDAVDKWAETRQEPSEERCGFGLTGCTGIGTIRYETPKGDLIMVVCERCDATDKGSIY